MRVSVVTMLKCVAKCSGENDETRENVIVGKLLLVGTSHFSKESQMDVRQIIRTWVPEAVVVELCRSRSVVLHMDEENLLMEASKLSTERVFSMIKQFGVMRGLTQALLLNVSAHITRQIGMAPGGEFRAAYEEASKIPGCLFQYGDRPISITMQRALAALGPFKKLMFLWSILMSQNVKIKYDLWLLV
ncbi:unnamed protein product [Soboliphyme baturini]|uniref:TraB domain-containing protein n=1 Tax=Soboliphyme baturini TaxID=241478 RepID=A0A183IE52_9BILA|nr:unnamed protein product [Soboliphyme baturini]